MLLKASQIFTSDSIEKLSPTEEALRNVHLFWKLEYSNEVLGTVELKIWLLLLQFIFSLVEYLTWVLKFPYLNPFPCTVTMVIALLTTQESCTAYKVSELYSPALKQIFTWHLSLPQQHLFQDPQPTSHAAWAHHPSFPFKICCHGKEFLYSLTVVKDAQLSRDSLVKQNNFALTVCTSRSYLWHLKGSFLLWTPLQAEAPGGTSRQSDEHFFFSSHDFFALDILSSQLQYNFRLQFLTGRIFYSHIHNSHHHSPVPTRPSAHFLLEVHTHTHTHTRVETVKPSLHCSSGLSAAALPMIRHLILPLVRGQSCPTHVSCQSHPLYPPAYMMDPSPERGWK